MHAYMNAMRAFKEYKTLNDSCGLLEQHRHKKMDQSYTTGKRELFDPNELMTTWLFEIHKSFI